MSARDATLRVLIRLCVEEDITEIILLKNKDNKLIPEFIKYLRRQTTQELLKMGPHFVIIGGVQNIEQDETKKLILNDFHLLPSSGHAGINRMVNNIKKYYYWPKMRNDVENFVKKCDLCQRNKHTIPVKEKLNITTTAYSSFEKVFLDLVGPLERDAEDNVYILTLQCELSKYVVATPLKNKEAESVDP